MKFFLLVFTSLVLTPTPYAQNLNFDVEYDLLLQDLSAENWTDAEKRSKKLLQFAEKDKGLEHELKVLRYIQIYANAGLLNEKKINKDEALKRVLLLKGLEMTMPAHPFRKNCYVNCTYLSEQSPNTFYTGVNNVNGTQIFSFEYVTIKGRIKETAEELEGKFVVLEGVLNEVNVEGNILPRFKLKFKDGKYEVVNE